MRRPEDIDHYAQKNTDRLKDLLDKDDRGDMVEQWFEQAKEMRSEIRAAHRVVMGDATDDQDVLELLIRLARAVEKNWKAVDRAYGKYTFARGMAGETELPDEDRPRYQEEWLDQAGVLAGRMYMMTNAWNTYRRFADAV
jgi:hypothetical protein